MPRADCSSVLHPLPPSSEAREHRPSTAPAVGARRAWGVRTMRTLQRADWLSVLVVASISAWVLVRRRRQRSRASDAATSDAGGNTIEAAELACAELGAIDQAWAAVVPEAVGVEDCTSQIGAMGGVQTYRVSAMVAEGCVMRAVLRQWSGSQETAVEQRLFVQRWCAACRVFALHGVGPRRLAEQPLRPRRLAEQGRADGWAIEEWPGTALHTVPAPLASGATTASWSGLDARTARAAGQLLARAHQIHTTWFEGFREAYQTCLPWLRGTARGSNAWVYASLAPGGLLCCDSSLRVLWADGSTAAPRHPVSARLVTTHGNFHPGNIVRPAALRVGTAYASGVERGGGSAAAEEGEEEDEELLRLVDFDCSCVAAAIFDIASAFALDESGHFDCFLAGYLDQLGGAWSSADLEAIRLDAALASRRIQSGLEAIRIALVEATVPPVPVHSASPAKARATAADFAAAKAAAAAAAEAAAADAAATTAAMADLDERANSFIAEMETEVAEEASRSASRAAMEEAVLEAELEEEGLQEEELEEEELEEQLETELEEQQLEEEQLEEQLGEQQLEEQQLEEQQLEAQQLGGQLEGQLEEQQLEEQQLEGQLEAQQLEAEAAVALAAAEEARAAAERAAERAAAAVEKLQAARQTPTPDPPAEIPDSSLAIPERSAAVVCSTVSTEAAEHPFLGLSPSDSLGSLESLGSLGSLGAQPPPRPISRAESGSSLDRPLSAQEAKEANRARRNSVAAQDWAIKRRQQMERAARIKGERAFSGRPSSATSSTGTPRRSPAVPAAATATSPPYSPAAVPPKPARAASHGANPVPRAASRSLSGALQAAAPPLEPQQPQTPPPQPPQLTSRRRSSPAEDVFALEDEDASNGSSSYTPLASSRPVGSPSTTTVSSPPPTASIDDWRTRRQARLARAACTQPPRSIWRLEAQRAELSTSPASQPSSPLRPGSTSSAAPPI